MFSSQVVFRERYSSRFPIYDWWIDGYLFYEILYRVDFESSDAISNTPALLLHRGKKSIHWRQVNQRPRP